MKILKRALLVLIVLIGIYLIIGLFAPSHVHVERSTFIESNAATVFGEINSLKQWKKWSYWDNIDSNMASNYEGPEAGVGAKHVWESSNDSVGNGSLTITKSEPNSFVETELAFEDMGTSLGGWKIRDTTGGVIVNTYMDIDVPFYAAPMTFFFNFDEMLGNDFQKSLEGLKRHIANLPSAPTTSVAIVETTLGPLKIMTIADSCTEKEIGMRLGSLYGEIGGVMNKQGLSMAGSPFAIYHRSDLTISPRFFVFDAGVSVDKKGKSDSRVTYQEIPLMKVVRGSFYGPYEQTSIAHELIDQWITDHGKTIVGFPWEVYVTDPGTEPDPSKWLTEIYYPIQ